MSLTRSMLLFAALLVCSGCGFITIEDALPPTLDEVDEIRNDSSLDAQEQREALRELGLDDVTINGVLQAQRTGNQFGGTLTTAWDKVVAETFQTMTPDEIQLYGDATATATFTDIDALAIRNLFADENINTPEELEALLDDPGVEIDAGIGAGDLRSVFIDTDPQSLIDLLP